MSGEENTGTALTVQNITGEIAKSEIETRKRVLVSILDKEDYVTIQGKQRKKKSYWRKLSMVYGISIEKVGEKREIEPDGSVTFYYTMRAIAPNGQFTEADGACNSHEKLDKNGKVVITSIHVTRATAETRAKNRAISDMLSFGEVSYEEIQGDRVHESRPAQPVNQANVAHKDEKAVLRAQQIWGILTEYDRSKMLTREELWDIVQTNMPTVRDWEHFKSNHIGDLEKLLVLAEAEIDRKVQEATNASDSYDKDSQPDEY